MEHRALKIVLLVNFIILLLLPVSVLPDGKDTGEMVKDELKEAGFRTVEIGEIPVLVPDTGVTVEIEHRDRLRAGVNLVRIHILYRGETYTRTAVTAKLEADGTKARQESSAVPPGAERAFVVKNGTEVTLEFRSGTLVIRTPGTALEDGAFGDRIRILNRRFNRIVTGTVSGPSRVSIP